MESGMDELIDLSSQIERDIERYERMLKDVRKTEALPVPPPYSRLEVCQIIERIIKELKNLRTSHGAKT
jgi:hypothetical protein